MAVQPAFAWNGRGHMVVAAVAWEKMTPGARSRAIALLKLNPQFSDWIASVPKADRPRVAFMKAATWPDYIRGKTCSTGLDCYRNDGYTPADANEGLNQGYSDHRVRPYWHFKDLPFSTDSTPLKQPFAPNAETQIVIFSDSLSQGAVSEEAKSYDLTWLLHLVGDVHQPLHATARFSSAFPDGDRGGNEEIVCRPAPAECASTGPFVDKLHGLWDEALGTSATASAARSKALKLLKQANTKGSFLATILARTNLDEPPAAWLQESFALAQKYVYAPPISDGKGPHFPTTSYNAAAGSISEQQVLIAGERLAILLNDKLAN